MRPAGPIRRGGTERGGSSGTSFTRPRGRLGRARPRRPVCPSRPATDRPRSRAPSASLLSRDLAPTCRTPPKARSGDSISQTLPMRRTRSWRHRTTLLETGRAKAISGNTPSTRLRSNAATRPSVQRTADLGCDVEPLPDSFRPPAAPSPLLGNPRARPHLGRARGGTGGLPG